MNNSLKKIFSKQYSFIPHPQAYATIRQFQIVRGKYQGFKETIKGKLPMNLRLSKLSNFERSLISLILLFWASVEYLERYT